MLRLFSLCLSLGLLVSFISATPAIAKTPLNVLIVTTQGVYHDYRQQTWILAHRIAEQANVRFDVSLAEIDRWRTTDYSEGYDAVIYNFCLADVTDPELIANMRRQTEELGVPALLIHCTMHSFRDTDLWWPMLGLKTTEHEPLRSLTMAKSEQHPITVSIPENWTLTEDELYINLEFEGQPLLTTIGEDGEDQVTAWLTYPGGTPVFGTTLGHSEDTIKNPPFQKMLANALLYVTGNLSEDGSPRYGMEGDGDGMDIFDTYSAPEGVRFLREEGHDCVFRELAFAAAPCYLGCILNPFEWGDATKACKKSCEAELPSPQELIALCSDNTG